MKICFMGSMDFAVTILEGLHKKYGVDLVVTQPDKPVGRKQILTGTPVKNKALEFGIDLFQPISIKKENSRILQEEFDFIIVAAYGQIIPEKVLFHGKHQAINVHASYLPKYRGGSPMHKAIINGDKETGVSIIYMEKALDSGYILSQKSCPIEETDDVLAIENKLSHLGRDLLIETIERLLQGDITPIPQEENLVSYAYNFKNEDLLIDFKKSAKQVYDLIRGMYPWPIAYFLIDDKKVKVFKTSYEEKNLSDVIGEVVIATKDRLAIQCSSGIINLLSLQLEGKKQMEIKDFMNGVGRTMFYNGLILK